MVKKKAGRGESPFDSSDRAWSRWRRHAVGSGASAACPLLVAAKAAVSSQDRRPVSRATVAYGGTTLRLMTWHRDARHGARAAGLRARSAEVNTTPRQQLGPQMQVALGPRPPLQLAFRGASLQIARRPRPDGPHARALAQKVCASSPVASHNSSSSLRPFDLHRRRARRDKRADKVPSLSMLGSRLQEASARASASSWPARVRPVN